MMPVVKPVAEWFYTYGMTLDDARSFRIQIGVVEEDARKLRDLVPHYKAAGFEDIVEECESSLAKSETLLERMRARLAAILAEKVQASARPSWI
jgi:hypothetical protein